MGMSGLLFSAGLSRSAAATWLVRRCSARTVFAPEAGERVSLQPLQE
jgi:hypothetical protein